MLRLDVAVDGIPTVEELGDVLADVVLEVPPTSRVTVKELLNIQHEVVKNDKLSSFMDQAFEFFL